MQDTSAAGFIVNLYHLPKQSELGSRTRNDGMSQDKEVYMFSSATYKETYNATYKGEKKGTVTKMHTVEHVGPSDTSWNERFLKENARRNTCS